MPKIRADGKATNKDAEPVVATALSTPEKQKEKQKEEKKEEKDAVGTAKKHSDRDEKSGSSQSKSSSTSVPQRRGTSSGRY
jgi:hypothetical protein